MRELTCANVDRDSHGILTHVSVRAYKYIKSVGFFFIDIAKRFAADGLNSHFEFPTGHSSTFHYAEISNHPVSQLANFTLAFWIKVFDLNHKGIILTYSSMIDNTTIFTFLSGPTLSMLVYSEPVSSSFKLKPGKWTHVLWKWNLTYGFHLIYVYIFDFHDDDDAAMNCIIIYK